MALSTEGATLLGPGPINNRNGGRNAEGICMGGCYRAALKAPTDLGARLKFGPRVGTPFRNQLLDARMCRPIQP